MNLTLFTKPNVSLEILPLQNCLEWKNLMTWYLGLFRNLKNIRSNYRVILMKT